MELASRTTLLHLILLHKSTIPSHTCYLASPETSPEMCKFVRCEKLERNYFRGWDLILSSFSSYIEDTRKHVRPTVSTAQPIAPLQPAAARSCPALQPKPSRPPPPRLPPHPHQAETLPSKNSSLIRTCLSQTGANSNLSFFRSSILLRAGYTFAGCRASIGVS